MPPARSPVPPHLAGRAFSTAEAAAAGITQDMLRGKQFVQLHHGVHEMRSELPIASLKSEVEIRHRAEKYLPRLRPHEAYSHTTALLLYGAPIRCGTDLHVTVQHPAGPARGAHILGHRTRTRFAILHPVGGLPCVPPQIALQQCGALLPFRELVVAIDHLIRLRGAHRGPPIIDHAALADYLSRCSGLGIDRVRAACEVARVGSDSRYESLMHFELARMGIDVLELQGDLYDSRGRKIGRFDQIDRDQRRILEFDGEQHRTDRFQYLKDERRLQQARDEGYEILRLHREDFRPAQVSTTRENLCRFLGLRPRPVSRRLARYFAEPES